ncbi:SCO6745 family protein [Micromonospora sp. NBC_00617]|uniref:SCO6745 family protein n=1 Tax=Micromonospora sp. NBC_00617 TaxID=2903587 RepID=UPI00386A2785
MRTGDAEVHVTALDEPGRTARLMWTHFEPVHAVTYFHPRARAAHEAVGLRGYWRGYFAGRAAPLGAAEAAPVIAAFFNFAPPMVSRALPAVWRLTTPQEALRARLTGAVQALAELTYELPEAHLAEAADLLERAASAAQTAGRVLGAANAALPVGEYPLARLWQAATTLRELRGDGHNAALVAAGLDPVETLAWRVAVDMSAENLLGRGWSEEQWRAARERLAQRGWLTGDGTATDVGRAGFQAIEDATDRSAAHPWLALGPDDTDRLRELLEPMARSCHTVIPPNSPIGLPALPG